MCQGCWDEYGSPKMDSPSIRITSFLIDLVYEEHSAGGNLHVILDDWNLEPEYLTEIWDKYDLDDRERVCLLALDQLTMTERASALGLSRGYW